MTVDAGRRILGPIEEAPVPTLSQLLHQVTDQNRHGEVVISLPPTGGSPVAGVILADQIKSLD